MNPLKTFKEDPFNFVMDLAVILIFVVAILFVASMFGPDFQETSTASRSLNHPNHVIQ